MKLSRINKGVKITLLFFIVFLIGLSIFFLITKHKDKPSSVALTTDLSNHSIYSKYEFDKSDSIINIGFQPMYLPTGVIFEIIKRDNILNKILLESGQKICYYPFLKGADVNYFLKQKKLDGGVGGDMPALSVSSVFEVEIPIVIQKGNASVVSNKPMLTDDLKGKRIAYPQGSISHYYILKLLESAGIEEHQVQLIPMEIHSMAEALHNKKIDLFSGWNPNVASALKQYPDFFIVYQKITTGYLYFSKAYSQENPETVNHILAAVVRAISWMKSDRENLLLACKWNITAMEKLTREKSNLNADELADLVLRDILRYYSLNEIVPKTEDLKKNSILYKEYEFLKKINNGKLIGNWEQVSSSFNNKLIKKILTHPKEFQLTEYNYNLNTK
jgi:ABC-type taurine transport system substrate-binding protein